MRIAVFAPDIPYPANRGGRADIWRRLLAFRQLGHQVLLVHLHEPTGRLAPLPEHLAVVDSTVDARFSFPIRRGAWRTLRQLAMAWHTPWHAATRVPTPEAMRQLQALVDDFAPDLLWLEGPWFGRVVLALSASGRRPFVYRSHNIEHRYLWRQAAAAVRLRDRIAWRLACIGVQRFEQQLMRAASRVFDISMDDLAFWQARGLQRLHWLPPLPELAVHTVSAAAVPGGVVFVGNLGTPNNVRGVEFLLGEVLPRVRAQFPEVVFSIVGSNPTPHVRACVAAAPGVRLHENVDEPMAHLLGARVVVNPVMTGSGVQVKMLDMLMTDLPIVTTPQGTRGLPAEMAALYAVAEHADDFAAAVCSALHRPDPDLPARRRARLLFTVAGVHDALVLAGGPAAARGPAHG